MSSGHESLRPLREETQLAGFLFLMISLFSGRLAPRAVIMISAGVKGPAADIQTDGRD